MSVRADTLEALAETMPAVVFVADVEGRCTWVNEEWTRVTGRPQADALGEGWAAALHPEDAPRALAVFTGLKQSPGEVAFDARLRRRDDHWAHMHARVRPQVVDGVVVGFFGVAHEVLTAGERARLEAHTDALLAAVPDLIFQVDARGVFVSYRAPAGAPLYMAPDQFLGRSLGEVMPAPVVQQTHEAMERAQTSGRVETFEYSLTIDRHARDYEARLTPLRTGGALVLVRDVTDRKRFEAELVAAREAADASNRHKTQFLANVSHEIRTPLNGILGATQLLKAWALPAEANEYVELLQSSADTLLGLVDDVLDLSKIEANRLELTSLVFDLEKTVTGAVRALQPLVTKKRLVLDLEVADSARGSVRGDAVRLRQVVSNLVGNAVKFTDTGRVHVRLARLPGSEVVTFSVHDSGPGIAPEMQERIFEPFVQLEGTRRFGGTGLGLSITRRLAQLMGGDVRVDSTVGLGTTFTATLVLPPVVVEEPVSRPSWRVTPPPRKLRVLLAEDNDLNAAMTAALIGKLGHGVEVVRDGRAAVEAVRDDRYDLVIMDVQMPVLDGLQATRLIREYERGGAGHLPIVALTANAMKGDDLLCIAAGMDAYLAKPVTVEALKDMLLWFSGN